MSGVGFDPINLECGLNEMLNTKGDYMMNVRGGGALYLFILGYPEKILFLIEINKKNSTFWKVCELNINTNRPGDSSNTENAMVDPYFL